MRRSLTLGLIALTLMLGSSYSAHAQDSGKSASSGQTIPASKQLLRACADCTEDLESERNQRILLEKQVEELKLRLQLEGTTHTIWKERAEHLDKALAASDTALAAANKAIETQKKMLTAREMQVYDLRRQVDRLKSNRKWVFGLGAAAGALLGFKLQF